MKRHTALSVLAMTLSFVIATTATLADMISVDGSAYASISADNSTNPSYTPDNLFDENFVIGEPASPTEDVNPFPVFAAEAASHGEVDLTEIGGGGRLRRRSRTG